MKTSFIIVGLVAVLLNSDSALAKQTPFASSLSARGFKAIAHRGTVTVYKHGSSSIIHIAAEGRLNAPPAEVRRVLLAYERQTRRIGRLSEARVIWRGAHRLLVYQRLNLPIVSDRDFTLAVSWGEKGDSRWIRYRAVSGGPAQRSGVVRVSTHEGSWQLKAMCR